MEKKKILLVVSTVFSVFFFFGCAKDDLSGNGSNNKIDGPVFDFSTTKTYALNIKFDVPEEYIVGFDVYTENPFEYNADGRLVMKEGITAIDRGFTDTKGEYRKPITVPAYVNQLYVYTGYAGVSQRLMVADVVNNVLSSPVPVSSKNQTNVMAFSTKAGINYNSLLTDLRKYDDFPGNQTLTLGKWHYAKVGPVVTTLANGETIKLYGRPNYMSYADFSKFGANAAANDVLKIDGKVLQAINTALQGDGMQIPVDPQLLKSGDIHVTKDAELDLIFIQNSGAYYNTLAYYCYETANPPTSAADVKLQVIAIPNAIELKWDWSWNYNVVSLYRGEGIKLKYVDKNGQLQDEFPAGVSVGWILYCNGFVDKADFDPSINSVVQRLGVGKGVNFSNPAFSVSPNTAVLRHGDFMVIGFDDANGNSQNTGYRDYLDVMFHVKSSPSDAITDNVPDVNPEDPKPVVIERMGILAYEDLWPYQGDFDMNDIVIKYISSFSINNKNEVISAEINFTVLHSGATFDNSFAYYDPNISNAEVVITGGEGAPEPIIDRTNNIIRLANNVLGYADKQEKVTFTVKYTYKTPIAKDLYYAPPFNPFITVGEPGNAKSLGKEVHLTNYAPTSVADKSWFEMGTHDWSNPELGLYYITYENHNAMVGADKGMQLPFAIHITFDKQADVDNFHITQEGKHINKHYPKFKNWINSNGKENADWFLHYVE